MHSRRAVRTSEIDERQSAFQLLETVGREIEARDDSTRVVDDLDEGDSAVGGAELVLHAAVASEADGLDGMRLARNLVGGTLAASEPVEPPSSATTTAADVPVEAPAGASERIVSSIS